MPGPRRHSREAAMQVLYKLDANPKMDPADAIDLYFEQLMPSKDGDPGAETGGRIDREWIAKIVIGVSKNLEQLDEKLSSVSRKWRVERMSRLDRCVLRMGLYEVQNPDDVPLQVIMNEAIELAKRFGTAEASAFVNGILDSAVKAK